MSKKDESYKVIKMKSHAGRMSVNKNDIFKFEKAILENKQRKIDSTKFFLDSFESKRPLNFGKEKIKEVIL